VLYLHIGLPRTGTTSLQRLLAENARGLERADYAYPSRWRDREGIGHHALGTAVLAGSEGSAVRDDFLRYVSSRGPRHVVVSTESLSNALNRDRFPLLYDLLLACSASDRVKVVVTMRRMDALLASSYLYTMKWGRLSGLTVDQFIEYRFDWISELFEKLHELREAQGVCSLELVTVVEGSDSTGPVLDAFGIDRSLLGDAPPARLGRRLGLKAQAALSFRDEWAGEPGLDVDLPKLLREFDSGAFEFRGETYDFDVLGSETRTLVHKHALRAATQCGVQEYIDAFFGSEIEPRDRVTVERSLISDADLDDLRAHLLGTQARVG
jgi:hypothetical protein